MDDFEEFSTTYDRMASLRPGQFKTFSARGLELVRYASQVAEYRFRQRRLFMIQMNACPFKVKL